MKSELCTGLVEDEGTPASSSVAAIKRVEEAGFGRFEATAAIEHTNGDVERALELLARGWSPIEVESHATSNVSCCPFLAGAGTISSSATLPLGHPNVPRSGPPAVRATNEPLMKAARVMAEKGVPVSQIAMLLTMDEASVAAALAQDSSGAIAGRVLGSNLQEELDDLLAEDPELCCPIALVLFSDPVIASDGFMYEKASLDTLFQHPTRHGVVSPMTRGQLKREYLSARQKKRESLEFREKRGADILNFAAKATAEQPHMAVTALERVSEYVAVMKPGPGSTLVQTASRLWGQLGRTIPEELRA